MTTNQPPTVEERLSRLEILFSNVGETVLAQNETIAAIGARVDQTTQNVDTLRESIQQVNQKVDDQSATIDVLVSNIQQLTENVAAVNQRVDSLAEQAAIDRQAWQTEIQRDREQAAEERQQAAVDRQEFRTSINRILDYLQNRNGGSPPPQAN